MQLGVFFLIMSHKAWGSIILSGLTWTIEGTEVVHETSGKDRKEDELLVKGGWSA